MGRQFGLDLVVHALTATEKVLERRESEIERTMATRWRWGNKYFVQKDDADGLLYNSAGRQWIRSRSVHNMLFLGGRDSIFICIYTWQMNVNGAGSHSPGRRDRLIRSTQIHAIRF